MLIAEFRKEFRGADEYLIALLLHLIAFRNSLQIKGSEIRTID